MSKSKFITSIKVGDNEYVPGEGKSYLLEAGVEYRISIPNTEEKYFYVEPVNLDTENT